jgi:two-component system C4-dicarboxylate transport sensor histidine kinase DctB
VLRKLLSTKLLPRWQRYRHRWVTGLLIVLFSALVLWQTAYWMTRIASDEIRTRSQNTLQLVVANLEAELRRFRVLPKALAAEPELIPVLMGTLDNTRLNLELERINTVFQSSDIYLMNADGLTIAASNWRSPLTFIGRNFSFRPYFQDAMAGRQGNFFGLGTTSKERGYFFSYPVEREGRVLGAIVVKITVDTLEQEWKGANNDQVLVVDENGVVFLATDARWPVRLLFPLSDAERLALRKSRRYQQQDDPPLAQLPVVDQVFNAQQQLQRISLNDGGNRLAGRTNYLVEQRVMADQGWTVLLLAKDNEVSGRVRIALTVAALMLASVLLTAANVLQRRRRLAEMMAMKDATSRELERRVEERTIELRERTVSLNEVNEQLREQIKEREQAEADLREAQAGLVQATKLAALGQMSAGVSHELNQPLAAIRSYSDNAKAFIERGNIQTASDNLQLITELADRMDRIIKNLRTYARDESISMRPVVVELPLKESIALLQNRIVNEAIVLDLELPAQSPSVMAGDVRLQQVFVNIISNAFDSMRNSPQKNLSIRVTEQGDLVFVSFADSGAGVPEALREHVFDPFYSTKSVGEGMGLGLSITYGIVDQFGGKIEISDGPEGGAVFTVILNKQERS